MNLNSHFKQSLIRSILNDLPDPGYKAKAMELAKKYHGDLIPDVIKKLIKTPDIVRLRQSNFYYTSSSYGTSFTIGVIGADPDAKLTEAQAKEIKDLLNLEYVRDKEIDKLRRQLENSFSGIRTLASLKKHFPEFEKYYPKEDEKVTTALVDTTVVTSLMQAGWPNKPEKEVKPTKKKAAA